MITTVDVETSWQKTETGGYDPSPFHPDNILVSVGINDEYYFTNHSEKVDKGCASKIRCHIFSLHCYYNFNIFLLSSIS